MPDASPELPAALYPRAARRAARSGWRDRGYDRLVVYADREHSANLSFLTGFDPRFEEAILIVGRDGDRAILVGNECWGMAGAAPLPMRRDLLPGPEPAGPAARPVAAARRDPRRRGRSAPAARVGVVGWKTYADGATDRGARRSSSTSCAG